MVIVSVIYFLLACDNRQRSYVLYVTRRMQFKPPDANRRELTRSTRPSTIDRVNESNVIYFDGFLHYSIILVTVTVTDIVNQFQLFLILLNLVIVIAKLNITGRYS